MDNAASGHWQQCLKTILEIVNIVEKYWNERAHNSADKNVEKVP